MENEWQANLKPIEIEPLIKECIHTTMALYPDAKYQMNIQPDAAVVLADEQGLRHIITNLIENALKYSNAPAQVEIGTQIDGKKFIIRVGDHGHGITADEKVESF